MEPRERILSVETPRLPARRAFLFPLLLMMLPHRDASPANGTREQKQFSGEPIVTVRALLIKLGRASKILQPVLSYRSHTRECTLHISRSLSVTGGAVRPNEKKKSIE